MPTFDSNPAHASLFGSPLPIYSADEQAAIQRSQEAQQKDDVLRNARIIAQDMIDHPWIYDPTSAYNNPIVQPSGGAVFGAPSMADLAIVQASKVLFDTQAAGWSLEQILQKVTDQFARLATPKPV